MRVVRTLLAVAAMLLMAEMGARWLEPRLPEPVTWSNPYTQWKHEQLLAVGEGNGVDVLFVGSSVVNANIDAAAFGDRTARSAYNVGLPSSNIPLWREYLAAIGLERACPRLVVVGVSLRDTNDNLPGFDGYVPKFRHSKGFRAVAGGLSWLETVEAWAARHSAFVRLRPRLREPTNVRTWIRTGKADGWVEPNLDSAGRYMGFANDPYRGPDQVEGLRSGALSNYVVGGRQFEALRGLIADARDGGAAVVIVDMPGMTSLLTEALANGRYDVDAYRAALQMLSEELGVELIRPQNMDDDASFFADTYHMNELGTQFLTSQLSDVLATRAMPPKPTCSAG